MKLDRRELAATLAPGIALVLLVLAGVGEGAVLGWAQSRMLRRELPRLGTGDWVGATAAGAAAAWTIGMLPSTLHAHLVELWPPMLIAFGIFRFVKPRAHPRWTKMRVNNRELTLWSFLMSSAHGAGLIIAPVLIGIGSASAATDPEDHMPAHVDVASFAVDAVA